MSRIIIIDDHPMLRNGIAQLFRPEGWEIVGEAGTAAEGIVQLRRPDWTLAILDIHLPDKNGLDLLADARAEGVTSPILVHSMMPDSSVGARVFKNGGNGVINKGCAPDDLLTAARRVMGGGKFVSAEFAEVLAGTLVQGATSVQPHENLSEREYQVMCLIAQGLTPSQIAAKIGCNVNTISTYRSRILTKLGLKTSMDIMKYALQHRLVML